MGKTSAQYAGHVHKLMEIGWLLKRDRKIFVSVADVQFFSAHCVVICTDILCLVAENDPIAKGFAVETKKFNFIPESVSKNICKYKVKNINVSITMLNY